MRVASLSLLVSGVDMSLQGTATDTPDVDVGALSILGRSCRTLGVGAPSVGSCWAGYPLPKERLANPSLKRRSILPLSTSPSWTVELGGMLISWELARLIVC